MKSGSGTLRRLNLSLWINDLRIEYGVVLVGLDCVAVLHYEVQVGF